MDVVFNTSQLQNASQEYLLESVIHETYHAYLYVNPSVLNNLIQHVYMAQNYVNAEVALLINLYPPLSANANHDALALVLAGYGDLQATNPSAFNAILVTYGMTAADVASTNAGYKAGTSGTKCN